MNIKQNPFSFYDFLGYFTPGAIFLYGVLLITGHVSGSNIFVYAEKYLSFKNAEGGRYRTPCIDIHRLHFLVKKLKGHEPGYPFSGENFWHEHPLNTDIDTPFHFP